MTIATTWSPDELTTLAEGIRSDVTSGRFLAPGSNLREEQVEMLTKLSDYFDPLHKAQKIRQWTALLEAGEDEALIEDWRNYFSPEQQRGLMEAWTKLLKQGPPEHEELIKAWEDRLQHGTANFLQAATGLGKSGTMAQTVKSFRSHVTDPEKRRVIILAPTMELANKAVRDLLDTKIFAEGDISPEEIGKYHSDVSNNKTGLLQSVEDLTLTGEMTEDLTSTILAKVSGPGKHALREAGGFSITFDARPQEGDETPITGREAISNMIGAFERASRITITPDQIIIPNLGAVRVQYDDEALGRIQHNMQEGESIHIDLQRNTIRRSELQKPIVAMTQDSYNKLRRYAINGSVSPERIDVDDFGLVEIDEVHERAGGTISVSRIEDVKDHAIILGQTATPKKLTGDIANQLFDGQYPIAHIGLQRAISNKKLPPVVEASIELNVEIPQETIAALQETLGGDYSPEALDALAHTEGRAEAIVDAYERFQCEHTGFRSFDRKAIDFCGSQDVARLHARAFEQKFGAGYAARVDAGTPKTVFLTRETGEAIDPARDQAAYDARLIETFEQYQQTHRSAGGVLPDRLMLDRQVGLNGLMRLMELDRVRVLNTPRTLELGIDIPDLELVIMSSPTLSHARYTQRLGRVTRIAEGKELGYVMRIVDKGLEDEIENERSSSHKSRAGIGLRHITDDGRFYMIPRSAIVTDLNDQTEVEFDTEWVEFAEQLREKYRELEAERTNHAIDRLQIPPVPAIDVSFPPFNVSFKTTSLETVEADTPLKEWLNFNELRNVIEDRLAEVGIDHIDRNQLRRFFNNFRLLTAQRQEPILDQPGLRADIKTLQDYLRHTGLDEVVGSAQPEGGLDYDYSDWLQIDGLIYIHRDALEGFTDYFREIEESRLHPFEDEGWLDYQDAAKEVRTQYQLYRIEGFYNFFKPLEIRYDCSDLRDTEHLLSSHGTAIPAGLLRNLPGTQGDRKLIHRDALPILGRHFSGVSLPMLDEEGMQSHIDEAYGAEAVQNPVLSALYTETKEAYDALELSFGEVKPVLVRGHVILSDMMGYDENGKFQISGFAAPLLTEIALGHPPGPRLDAAYDYTNDPSWKTMTQLRDAFWRFQSNDEGQEYKKEGADT